METIDPHTLGMATTIAGVSFAMVWLATKLNMLEARRQDKCPACGVIRRHGACNCSG
jgi:hypothetical protein